MKSEQTIRNITIFAIISAAAGWIGLALNRVLGLTDPTQNLGMLIFLLLPFLTGLILRAVGGDGWSDIGWKSNLRGPAVGYWVALFAYPAIIALVLLFGYLAGGVSFAGFATTEVGGFMGIGAFLFSVGFMFAADFVKNIFEEFAWRGYLTPRLKAAGLHDLLNHLLTGAVWASWHIPYWLFLLDKTTYADFTTVSLSVFLPLSIVSIITSAILYGEVRLLTDSTVPAIVLHSVANAVTLSLLLEDFISVEPASEIWFTPGGGGIIGIALVTLAGMGLYVYRKRQMK
ncbi:MAG: type II CAAX prenyl endopeptidase Rce1 family protein [Chloroflexota bacterium]